MTILGETWLEQVAGVVPIIVTAAHSGGERISGIALSGGGTRRGPSSSGSGTGCDTFNNGMGDDRTREVAEGILHHMESRNMRPYVVLPLPARRDLDLNRTWAHNQGGYGSVSASDQNRANRIYSGYYDRLEDAIQAIRNQFDTADAERALLFDVHGLGEDDIDAGIDIELGTRGFGSADSGIVYTDTSSVEQALRDQGFRLRSDADTTERWGGCEVLRQTGLTAGGINAVQIELSPAARGNDGSDADDERRIAIETGEKIARAIEAFLIDNDYPNDTRLVAETRDDEVFAALSMAE